MAVAAGSRVGPYEILAPIGRGGMGEVYRARDSNLHRDVAIKTLPDAVSQNRDRLLRFEREARLLAALNHPNIAAIYDLQEQDGSKFLIMEFITGWDLADELAAGPLPLAETLAVAAQIAAGLEAAHDAGIIHRDLKPSNVKLRSDGVVKVLDFGLARTVEPATGHDSDTLSPTLTAEVPHEGAVLGTAAYMSPEQARGKPLDKKSDIFSFGCVLYECLTGKRAFQGETITDILSAILTAEPDWSILPAATPQRIRELVRHCLQKDPKQRLHDIADARIEIEEARVGTASGPTAMTAASIPSKGRLGWGIAALLGAVIATVALLLVRRPQPSPPPIRVRAILPLSQKDRLDPGWLPNVALSPDGRTIVFRAVHDGTTMLVRRPLDGVQPEPIAGTEGGSSPFFSPDGQWIGFVTPFQLRKVPLSGGTAISLSPVPPITAGGSWREDGRIVLARKWNGALDSISETGGEFTPLTRLDASRGEHAHVYPQALPGGRGILFTLRRGRDFADTEASDIAVLEPGTRKWKTLLEGAKFARYGGGRLVFLRGDSVFSAPFDLSLLAVTGPAVALSENVAVNVEEGFGQFDVSPGGSLAFIEGSPVPGTTSTVLLLDRSGRESPLPLPATQYYQARFSPNGARLVLTRFEGLRGAIVMYDRERKILSTLTPEPGSYFDAIWSPDGRRVTFSRFADGSPALCVKNADGSGEIEALTARSDDAEFPTSWSPDGKTILYTVAYTGDRGPKRPPLSTDLWIVSPGDARSARPWLESPFRETAGVFSPDGRWIAYVSDESGVQEVYIRPYPGPGASVKVSDGFAIEPLWSRDGRELYFRTGDGAEKFMASQIRTTPGLTISPPKLLFSSGLAVGAREDRYREYDVSADGKQFVSERTKNPEEPNRQLMIVTSWAGTSGP